MKVDREMCFTCSLSLDFSNESTPTRLPVATCSDYTVGLLIHPSICPGNCRICILFPFSALQNPFSLELEQKTKTGLDSSCVPMEI